MKKIAFITFVFSILGILTLGGKLESTGNAGSSGSAAREVPFAQDLSAQDTEHLQRLPASAEAVEPATTAGVKIEKSDAR